MRKKAVVPPYK